MTLENKGLGGVFMIKKIFLFIWCMYALTPGKGTNYRVVKDANVRNMPFEDSIVSYTVKSGDTFFGKKEDKDWIRIEEFKIATKNADGTTSYSDVYNKYIHKSFVEKKLDWIKIIKNLFWVYVAYVIISVGKERQCPSCKKFFARKKLSKTFIDSDEDYDTVTRVDTIKNRRGETIATKERQEQVHMTTNYYRVDCKCKKCGYEWYYITSHRFEG